jgi:cytochrome c oxidase assembly factor CtaG
VRVLLHGWQFDAPAAAVLATAGLYALGMDGATLPRRRAARARWFALGMLALVVALASPVEAYDDTLLWVHMVQHLLLLTVAPPLILLGRPGVTCWRALPLDARRRGARALAHGRAWAPLRAAVRVLTTPPVALGLFIATMAVWHVPALFDATLRSAGVHDLEHGLFLLTGLLLWACVIDSPPVRSRLTSPARAAYAAIAMVACWLLALVLGLASTPFYAGYAGLPSRPGGISALADQHIAAGIMWVPGSIPFVLAVALLAYRWLGDEAPRRDVSLTGAAR